MVWSSKRWRWSLRCPEGSVRFLQYAESFFARQLDNCRNQIHAQLPRQRNSGAARLVAGKSLDLETTDFDCHRVERTSLRAQFALAEVQRVFSAHFLANTRLKG
jgi:hypothetical protein